MNRPFCWWFSNGDQPAGEMGRHPSLAVEHVPRSPDKPTYRVRYATLRQPTVLMLLGGVTPAFNNGWSLSAVELVCAVIETHLKAGVFRAFPAIKPWRRVQNKQTPHVIGLLAHRRTSFYRVWTGTLGHGRQCEYHWKKNTYYAQCFGRFKSR